MNKSRRERLKDSIPMISKLMDVIESIRDEEQESLDSLPGNLSESERAMRMEEIIDSLDEACNNLDDINATINDIIYG